MQGARATREEYNLVIAHGNGPQVGLLALQAAAYTDVEPYPFDVLGAQTQGMIAYMVEQELGNVLPFEKPIATVLTMVEVDPHDSAFDDPTKFVGPVYTEEGAAWRRVVASPEPKHIFELAPIRWLMEKGTVVICAGGGGIPTVYLTSRCRWLSGRGDDHARRRGFAAGLHGDWWCRQRKLMGLRGDWIHSTIATPPATLIVGGGRGHGDMAMSLVDAETWLRLCSEAVADTTTDCLIQGLRCSRL